MSYDLLLAKKFELTFVLMQDRQFPETLLPDYKGLCVRGKM